MDQIDKRSSQGEATDTKSTTTMPHFLDFLKLQEDSKTHVKVTMLQNPDLTPLPPYRRTWNWWGFTAYWLLNNMALSGFTSAAAIIGYGLSVPSAMAVVILGNFTILVTTILNGQPGGDHHISFTTYSRVMFGCYGCYLAILMRAALGVVWFASQAWLGGLMINSTISCLSYKYLVWENTFPDSVPFTNKELCGFILLQLVTLPFVVFKPHKFRIVMGIASFCGYCAMIGITIAAVVDNNGSDGPLMSVKANTVHGSAFSWVFMKSFSSWYGSSCAGVVNKPDYTRFSTHRYSQIFGSIIGKLVLSTFIPFMGIVTISAMQGKWGISSWTLNAVLDNWLMNYYTPKVRAGVFFASTALWIGQVVFSTVGNAWSFGMDFSGICPRYINIRRGSLLCVLLTWIIQPWTMYNTNTNFGTVVSGFSVVLSPMVAIIICDYWVIRRRKLKLTDLFTNSPDGIYYGYKGFNVQALTTFFAASVPGLPGLINQSNASIPLNSTGMLHYYYGNTVFGFSIAFAMYWTLCTIWKPKGLGEMDDADYYGTYWPQECELWGLIPQDQVDKEVLAQYVTPQDADSLSTSELEGTDEASFTKEVHTVVVEEKRSL